MDHSQADDEPDLSASLISPDRVAEEIRKQSRGISRVKQETPDFEAILDMHTDVRASGEKAGE